MGRVRAQLSQSLPQMPVTPLRPMEAAAAALCSHLDMAKGSGPVRYLTVLMILSLGGCGIPPIYSVLAYAIDGGMLLATGKTTTDHGLSMATGADCQLWRVVNGREICEDPAVLAQAEDASETALLVRSFDALETAEPIDLSMPLPHEGRAAGRRAAD